MSAPAAHTEVASGSPDLGSLIFRIDPGMAIWTWLFFGLLLVLLWKFAWKPILKVLDDREKHISDSLENAEKARQELERVTTQQKQLIHEAEKRAVEIIQQARVEASTKAEEVLEKAVAEAKTLSETVHADVQREKEAALREIRAETINLALLAAGKVLEERLDGDAQRKTAERFIDTMSRN
ncbi:MAG: F0F1 ATP synthase subunit B [Spirochaetes bacterium]|nr:F0F1 ATP synthase subunit B [Spirochaetota bacterium]